MCEKPDDIWSVDPDYPLEDWQYEVACDYTRNGYWEWIASKREADMKQE